jgi:hypothetical protein
MTFVIKLISEAENTTTGCEIRLSQERGEKVLGHWTHELEAKANKIAQVLLEPTNGEEIHMQYQSHVRFYRILSRLSAGWKVIPTVLR